jgi:hypothetical protein
MSTLIGEVEPALTVLPLAGADRGTGGGGDGLDEKGRCGEQDEETHPPL